MLCSECKIWGKSSHKFCWQEEGLFCFIVRINRLFSITVAVRRSGLYPYFRVRRPHAQPDGRSTKEFRLNFCVSECSIKKE